jgi:carboxypeptidase Taq
VTAPAAVDALRERAAELADLSSLGSLLFWDRSTHMPPAGAPARAEQASTIERLHHRRLTDPQVGRWLDEAEAWAAHGDCDDLTRRELALMRRDFEKAARVPEELAGAMAHAGGVGEAAWLAAREADDFGELRDALERHLELRHRYVACFDGVEHPYDALLDDFEPGATTARLRPLFAALRDELVALVAAAATGVEERNAGVLHGDFPVAAQEAAVREVLAAFGFDDASWRLDAAPHPFAQALGPADVRLTTKYDRHDLGVSLYSALHEFGHGMYEAGVDPALRRRVVGRPDSLGLHESQSRLWENALGRSEGFCRWVVPVLGRHLDLGDLTPERLFWGVNVVRPSLIRIYADETTYNLHVVLRFELELALMEGTLAVADLPAAWAEGMHRLLGVEVPSDNQGVLQDIHWGAGMIGYFPTYTLGNLICAQLWERVLADLPDLDESVARGEFAPLREWLRERVHRHGRRLDASGVVRAATGADVAAEPLLRYLRTKLAEAGILA